MVEVCQDKHVPIEVHGGDEIPFEKLKQYGHVFQVYWEIYVTKLKYEQNNQITYCYDSLRDVLNLGCDIGELREIGSISNHICS